MRDLIWKKVREKKNIVGNFFEVFLKNFFSIDRQRNQNIVALFINIMEHSSEILYCNGIINPTIFDD